MLRSETNEASSEESHNARCDMHYLCSLLLLSGPFRLNLLNLLNGQTALLAATGGPCAWRAAAACPLRMLRQLSHKQR